MSMLAKIKEPPWRTIVPACLFFLIAFVAYSLWQPASIITDGRHDLQNNGIWIQHGWLGDDAWYKRTRKDPRIFRNAQAITNLSKTLNAHGIKYVYPHLCPCAPNGQIDNIDAKQTELFLNHMNQHKVLPWVGGVYEVHASPAKEKWRKTFVASISAMLTKYPRLAGIHINIEPMPSGNKDFLLLLEEIKQAMPDDKILSIAAYPPPTKWHRFSDVHWDEGYFREVAKRSDQMVVMMYDTAIRYSKFYQSLMAKWTDEVLVWSGDTDALLGVPVYDDAGVGYHHPKVENMENSLKGIHAGLLKLKALPSNYQGTAIYCEWEMDNDEWTYFKKHFNKKNPK